MLIPLSSSQPRRETRPRGSSIRGQQAGTRVKNQGLAGSRYGADAAPLVHLGTTDGSRLAARPEPGSSGRQCPPGGAAQAARPRPPDTGCSSPAEGQRREGAGSDCQTARGAPRAQSPAHLRVHFARQILGRIPTSSSRVPPEPDPVTVLVSVLVLCSPSGFRLLMVRGVGWGWRGEGNAEGERGARPQRGGGKGRGERCAPGLRGGVAVGAARGGERQPPRRVGVTSSLAGAATEALGTGAEPERPPPPPFHCDPRVRPRRRRGAGAGTGLSWGPASPFPLPPCGLRGNVQPIPAAHCGLAPARAVARQPLAGLFPSLPCPFSLPLSSFPFPFSTTSF